MIDYSQPTEQDKISYYQIKMKIEHGDADATTFKTIEYDETKKEEMETVLKFLFAIRNFIPNCAYNNLGYYKPINDSKKISDVASKIWPDVVYPMDIAYDILDRDIRWRDEYAKLTDVELFVNSEKRLLMDMSARSHNIIKLPEIGSEFVTNMGHVCGTSSFEHSMPYYNIVKEFNIPIHTDETKKTYTPITGIVKSYQISKRYNAYDVYDLLIKMNHEQDIYFTSQMHGHVEY